MHRDGGIGIYRLAHGELDPIVDRINRLLALTPKEHSQFLFSRPRGLDVLDYHRANLQTLKVCAPAALPEAGAVSAAPPAAAQAPTPVLEMPLATLGHIFSAWIITLLVFLLLLRDTGEIKRGLLRAVPNRLFEPALTAKVYGKTKHIIFTLFELQQFFRKRTAGVLAQFLGGNRIRPTNKRYRRSDTERKRKNWLSITRDELQEMIAEHDTEIHLKAPVWILHQLKRIYFVFEIRSIFLVRYLIRKMKREEWRG